MNNDDIDRQHIKKRKETKNKVIWEARLFDRILSFVTKEDHVQRNQDHASFHYNIINCFDYH
jgi:hypothetical protein